MLEAQLVPTSSEWRRSLKTNGRQVRHYPPQTPKKAIFKNAADMSAEPRVAFLRRGSQDSQSQFPLQLVELSLKM